MKKIPQKIVTILLLISSILIKIATVEAYERDNRQTEVTNKQTLLVCSYGNKTDANQGAEIYYELKKVGDSGFAQWNVFYRKNNMWEFHSRNSFHTTFTTNSQIHHENDGDRYTDADEATFTCPTNNFMDFDWWDELCFGNYNSCGKEFEGGPYGQTKDGTTIFEIINKFAEEDVYQYLTIAQLKDYATVLNFVKSRTRTYITTEYALGTTYVMPPFIDNYLNTLETHIDINNSSKYLEAKSRLEAQAERRRVLAEQRLAEAERNFANGTITQEEVEQAREVTENAREEAELVQEEMRETLYEALGSPPVNGVNVSDEPDCHGLLGVQMTEIVNNVFSFVQYLAPVLIAALSIVDFVKASLSGDDGDMKKASQKLVKRAICGVLLFFIPLLCKVLFGIAGITVPEYCIGR